MRFTWVNCKNLAAAICSAKQQFVTIRHFPWPFHFLCLVPVSGEFMVENSIYKSVVDGFPHDFPIEISVSFGDVPVFHVVRGGACRSRKASNRLVKTMIICGS
jgi:hypothetical protein